MFKFSRYMWNLAEIEFKIVNICEKIDLKMTRTTGLAPFYLWGKREFCEN